MTYYFFKEVKFLRVVEECDDGVDKALNVSALVVILQGILEMLVGSEGESRRRRRL